MTRLAMGGLVHEIVTFLPEETTLEAFEERAIRGAAIIEAYQGHTTVYSSFLNTCQENGVAIEGLLCTECAPSGPVARQVFEALALIADGVRPIVLLEHADRGNDTAHLLQAMLKRGVGRAVVPYLHDPIVAKAAASAGVGNQLIMALGGNSSELAGMPILFTGIVKFAGPLRYRISGPYRTGGKIDLGAAAVLDSGAIIVIVTTQSVTAVDTDPFTQCGLDTNEFDIIALHSKTHFRAAYAPIAGAILMVETPDWGHADLLGLPCRNAPPGIYPITMAPPEGGILDETDDGANDAL